MPQQKQNDPYADIAQDDPYADIAQAPPLKPHLGASTDYSNTSANEFYENLPSKALSVVKAVPGFIKENLPAVGGVGYGIAGGLVGGPVGAVAGAVLGGGAGEAGKQLINTTQGKGPKTSAEAAEDIAGEGAKQGAYELGGQLIGAVG